MLTNILAYYVTGDPASRFCLTYTLPSCLRSFGSLTLGFIYDSLNLFYVSLTLLNSHAIIIQLKNTELKISLHSLINFLLASCVLPSMNFYVSLLFICLFFNFKFIDFNHVLLDIFHDDAAEGSDGGEATTEPTESTEDNDDQEDSSDDYDYPMMSIQWSLSIFDASGIINSIIAYRKKLNETNKQCQTTDILVEKLMRSRVFSASDLEYLQEVFKSSTKKLIDKKLLKLKQSRPYSIKEMLDLVLNLRKVKNSIIVLPNGLFILTCDIKNLKLLALPSILQISNINLSYIIKALNLKKKLNLYLTKECFKSGDLWEKSFYVAEFLLSSDTRFNKDYLILECFNPRLIELMSADIQLFNCDILTFNETMYILNQRLKKRKQFNKLENTNPAEPTKVCENDVLTNKVSMDVVLENVVTVKKTTLSTPSTKKLTWWQRLKNFFSYVKSKIQDLTIPALIIYYYTAKIILYTPFKHLIIIIITMFIFYKCVYQNKKKWISFQFTLWFYGLAAYLYFLWTLFFGNIYSLLASCWVYLRKNWLIFLLQDFMYICAIWLCYFSLKTLTLNDFIWVSWYNILLCIHDWLLIKLNYWTLLSLYIWPYWYFIVNIKTFIYYFWSLSCYRDPFICYLAKFLALLYLFMFPSIADPKSINAGRISSLLRWLHWNPQFFMQVQAKLIYYVRLFYTSLFFIFYILFSSIIVYGWNRLKYIIINFLIYLLAFILFLVIYFWYDYIQNTKKKRYSRGAVTYYGYSESWGDRVSEKMFNLFPLDYKISWEFWNLEWGSLLNYNRIWPIKNLIKLYNFIIKNFWLFLKNYIYTHFDESLIEFYCEMHLWIEYYLFKYLGDFLELYLYIPYYVKVTTVYLTEIVWATLMDMHMLIEFFGLKPLVHSIESYVRYRATLLQYQYWFWKNYQYEYNRKKLYYQHVFTIFYWQLNLHYKFKQRSEARERIFKSWYIWWR